MSKQKISPFHSLLSYSGVHSFIATNVIPRNPSTQRLRALADLNQNTAETVQSKPVRLRHLRWTARWPLAFSCRL